MIGAGQVIHVDIKFRNCPRCGAKHSGLEFRPMDKIVNGCTYSCPCPATGETIYCQVVMHDGILPMPMEVR